MEDGWKSFKTGFARTKHKVLEKFGATEATVDTRITEESEKLFVLFKLVKRLKKSTAKYEDILKNIIILQNEVAQDILSFKDTDPTFIAYQECQKHIEKERARITDELEYFYHDPLRNYIAQFKEIRSRLAELELRRLDMDRYHRDYTIKANKGNTSTSLAKTEGKHTKTKDGYQSLLDELLRDMSALFNDRKEVFDPVVTNFINRNSEFFNFASQQYRGILSYYANTNEYHAADHKWVVTSIENSSMNKNIRSNAVFTSSPKEFTPSNTSPTMSRPRASTIATTSPTSKNESENNNWQQQQQQPVIYQPPQQQESWDQEQPVYQPPVQQQRKSVYQPQVQQPTYTLPQSNNSGGSVSLNKTGNSSPPFAPLYPNPNPPTAKFQQLSVNSPQSGGGLSPTNNQPGQRKSMYAPNSNGLGGPQPNFTPPQFKVPSQLKPSAPPGGSGRPLPVTGGGGSGRPLPAPMKKGEALYDFAGLDSKELTFKKGDIISFTKTVGDWYDGELNGAKGLVPSNYVRLI